jgi:hypothetical protein
LAVREPVLALAVVPLPDLSEHARADAIGLGRPELRLRPRDQPAAPIGAVEEEVERGLEDLGGGGTGLRVRERVAGAVELGEEAARNRDVEAGELRRERLDDGAIVARR